MQNEFGLNGPLIFEPYLRPQVWGGQELARRLGKKLPQSGPYGESWEISDHPVHESLVAEGPLRGLSLGALLKSHRTELLGKQAHLITAETSGEQTRFPLLIKFLDCHEPLSVQVHPNDELARQLANEQYGKTESWIVVSVDQGGWIQAGLKPGTTKAQLLRGLKEGTVADCLHTFHPAPGDVLHLPAGTVHAIGGGVVLAEIQQNSDATFRLFDWNRLGLDGKPRKLHIEQSLQAINWSQGPLAPQTPQRLSEHAERLVTCPHYQIDRVNIWGTCHAKGIIPLCPENWETDVLSIWMVLAGNITLSTPEFPTNRLCRTGETILIPAACQEFAWTPVAGPVTMLRVQIPQ